jgi:hypothetical protein
VNNYNKLKNKKKKKEKIIDINKLNKKLDHLKSKIDKEI